MINVKLPVGTQIWQCLRTMVLVHIIKLLCIINLLQIGRKALIQLGCREYKPHVIYKEGSLNQFYFLDVSVCYTIFPPVAMLVYSGILLLAFSTLESGPYLMWSLVRQRTGCATVTDSFSVIMSVHSG